MHTYLMDRAKKSLSAGDSCMAKSWLLTCSVLFPRSFSLQVSPIVFLLSIHSLTVYLPQYDRYQIAKQEGNVTEAIACLSDLLQNPEGDDYPELKQEKRAIVDVVRYQDPSPCDRQVRRTRVVNSSTSGTAVKPPDPETQSFLRSLFSGLSSSLKHKILMSVARQADASWYDSCQLMVTCLRTFPTEVQKEGRKLVQQIIQAQEADPRNRLVYQQMLIFDLMPLLFDHETGLEFQDGEELLSHLITVFSYFTQHSCISDPDSDPEEDLLLEERMLQIVGLAFRRMGWDCGLVSSPTGSEENIDIGLMRLTTAFEQRLSSHSFHVKEEEVEDSTSDGPMDLSVPTKKQKVSHKRDRKPATIDPMTQLQLLTASCLLFLRSLVRFARESRSLDSQFALIEVHENSPMAGSTSGLKPKIIPHHSSSTDHLLPDLLVRSPCEQRLRSAFLTCVRTIDLMVGPGIGSLVQRFFSLLKETGAEDSPSYQDLRRDACFFKGQHEDFIRQTVVCMSEERTSPPTNGSPAVVQTVRQMVQVISASLVVHDYKAAVHQAILAVQQLSHLPPGSPASDQENESECHSTPGLRTFRLLPLNQESVFSFCHTNIITCLKYTTLLSLKPADSGIGHLLVLSQYQWPRHVDVFRACISALTKPLDSLPTGRAAQPQIHRFVYLPFMEYVQHPDLLEEFMALASDERLQLELSASGLAVKQQSGSSGNGRMMTTRGVNKGAKEEVRQSLVKQMSDSRLDVGRDLILRFIVHVLPLIP